MNTKKVSIVISLITFFVIVGMIFFIPTVTVLSICNRKNISERLYSAAGFKNGFVISYTHSVNKGRVHDYYLCKEDKTIVLDHTVFVSYGAGIPEPEETPGAIFSVTNDGYTISNLNRTVPRLLMAVGIVANHSIAFDYNNDFNSNNAELFLTDFFKPQTSLILEIKRISLWEFLTHIIR